MRHELFAERVHSFRASGRRFDLLVGADGSFLGVDDEALVWRNDADDTAMWHREGSTRFRNATKDVTVELDAESIPHAAQGAPRLRQCVTPSHGPERLPSDYLADMRAAGWTCLTSILDPETVEALERVAGTDRYAEAERDTNTPPLCQDPAVARTVAEPVSLWVIREYMAAPEIRVAHTPGFAVLTPDDGQRNVQGWHADYPYHWGVPAAGQVPPGFGVTALGVQRNVCVSPFTKVGGATAFRLGSHSLDAPPPVQWGDATTHAVPGYRKEHGLPYNGPDADIVEAPGGSIILYDSRTWHRAGVNRTPHRRAAILQAMVPMFVMPKNDTASAYQALIASDAYQALKAREQTEMRRLMVHHFIGPGREHAIGVDRTLTDHLRQARAAS